MTYPSDLSDKQWYLIKHFIPLSGRVGRPREVSLRVVLNAIFYVNKTGCPWRYLPQDFPKWRTVYDYFSSWQRKGVWSKINKILIILVRRQSNKNDFPSLGIIDAQSVKAQWGEDRGYDGFKKVRGRKRSIVVDTLGLIHEIRVDSAAKKDHQSGIQLFKKEIKNKRLSKLLADGGYKRNDFSWLLGKWHGIEVECTSSKIKQKYSSRKLLESNLRPTRWIVERTFAWLNNYRRLSRDYEKKTGNSVGSVLVAMIQLMLRRMETGGIQKWH